MESGQRVVAGRYRLLAPLGSGGMGTVWRAEDEVLGRMVAVKEVTFPHGLSDADRDVLRERTRREARAAAKLDHPSAVTVYDVVEDGEAPYLVMELVEARTLSQVVRADGPLSPQRTARIGLALLGALEAAHAHGIVHRDVKPGNVLLSGDGDTAERVVLTDFGIASSAGDSSITSTGLLLGSPSYIAPERARGQPPAPASDLWSLGATLFTAVEGKPPFDAGEPLLTVTAVVTGEHAPFERAGPLEEVVEGLLERDPERRLTAAAARRRLERVARSAPVDAAPTVTTPVATPAPGKPQAERTAALPVADVREAAQAPAAEPAPRVAPRPVAPPPVAPPPGERPAPTWSRPPRIATSSSRRRSRLPVAIGAVALALAAALVAVVVATDPGRSDLDALPGGSDAAPDAPADGAGDGGDTDADSGDGGDPDAGADDAAGPAPVPDGWQTFEGGPGWVVAVPPTYARSTFKGAPQYKQQSTGRTLRISTTGPGGGRADAVQDRRDQAAAFARTHGGYREIDISKVDYRGYEAADWEFLYTSGGARLHALSRVFVVDGRGYSLFFQTRASDDWDAARTEFEQIAASFRPA